MSGETDQVKWRGVQPVNGIAGVWPGRNATRVNADGRQAPAGTNSFYTVPDGKKLFISSINFSSTSDTVSERYTRVIIRNAADADQFYPVRHTYREKGFGSVHCTFSPALELAAGWDVCVHTSANNITGVAAIHGWLEDA